MAPLSSILPVVIRPLSPRPIPAAAPALILLAALLLFTTGCEEQVLGVNYAGATSKPEAPRRVGPARRDGFIEGLFGNQGGTLIGDDGQEQSSTEWALLLGRFEGPSHEQQAQDFAAELARTISNHDIWLDSDPETEVSWVYQGRYPSVGSVAAQADLLRWRELRRTGLARTPVLALTPLVDRSSVGADEQWNLLAVGVGIPADYVGDMYSLQVAYFDQEFRGDRRREAERIVTEMRQAGEEAYYYHGPYVSSVTVGLFNPDDLAGGRIDEDGVPTYGPAVEELRARHPLNIGNGNRIPMSRTAGGAIRYQPSIAVRVPRER